jgi:hypothetical protein
MIKKGSAESQEQAEDAWESFEAVWTTRDYGGKLMVAGGWWMTGFAIVGISGENAKPHHTGLAQSRWQRQINVARIYAVMSRSLSDADFYKLIAVCCVKSGRQVG